MIVAYLAFSFHTESICMQTLKITSKRSLRKYRIQALQDCIETRLYFSKYRFQGGHYQKTVVQIFQFTFFWLYVCMLRTLPNMMLIKIEMVLSVVFQSRVSLWPKNLVSLCRRSRSSSLPKKEMGTREKPTNIFYTRFGRKSTRCKRASCNFRKEMLRKLVPKHSLQKMLSRNKERRKKPYLFMEAFIWCPLQFPRFMQRFARFIRTDVKNKVDEIENQKVSENSHTVSESLSSSLKLSTMMNNKNMRVVFKLKPKKRREKPGSIEEVERLRRNNFFKV